MGLFLGTWRIQAPRPDRQHFFGQYSDGDEANSLPVYMSRDAAMQVLATVDRWGGMPASIRCLLGHRKHFKALRRRDPDGAGWLNWCLWMDPDKPEHKLTRLSAREVATNTPLNSATHSNIYSGYIWKCFTLHNW